MLRDSGRIKTKPEKSATGLSKFEYQTQSNKCNLFILYYGSSVRWKEILRKGSTRKPKEEEEVQVAHRSNNTTCNPRITEHQSGGERWRRDGTDLHRGRPEDA